MAGVLLEVASEAVASDGAVLIARERMWSEEAPESSASLRSTGTYRYGDTPPNVARAPQDGGAYRIVGRREED